MASHTRDMPTTRPKGRHDTVPNTWRAHSQGPLGVHLCTRPIFDSVHYFESLFGSLFMDTVHEHCSRGFSKNIYIIINKIK